MLIVIGTFSTDESFGACQLCPTGTYSRGTGSTGCSPCPPSINSKIQVHCPHGCARPQYYNTHDQTADKQKSVFVVESEDPAAEEVLITTLFYDTTQAYAPTVYGALFEH